MYGLLACRQLWSCNFEITFSSTSSNHFPYLKFLQQNDKGICPRNSYAYFIAGKMQRQSKYREMLVEFRAKCWPSLSLSLLCSCDNFAWPLCSIFHQFLSEWSSVLLLCRIVSWFSVAHLFYFLSNLSLCMFFLAYFLFFFHFVFNIPGTLRHLILIFLLSYNLTAIFCTFFFYHLRISIWIRSRVNIYKDLVLLFWERMKDMGR